MTGQSTITGSAPAYAGGSITAVFQPRGGGAPAQPQNAATIAADGTFSILGWDNTNAIYKPSATVFLIQIGKTQFSATVVIAGTSASITTALATAPTPNPSVGGVLITNTPSASGKVLTSTGTNSATWQ